MKSFKKFKSLSTLISLLAWIDIIIFIRFMMSKMVKFVCDSEESRLHSPVIQLCFPLTELCYIIYMSS